MLRFVHTFWKIFPPICLDNIPVPNLIHQLFENFYMNCPSRLCLLNILFTHLLASRYQTFIPPHNNLRSQCIVYIETIVRISLYEASGLLYSLYRRILMKQTDEQSRCIGKFEGATSSNNMKGM